MARTLSIFDLWGDMIANPTKYGNSAMREARAKQLENIQQSEANLIDNTYRTAKMHRSVFADRYASNIANNYYRWIAGGGTPDSFFKAQFATIDADPQISGVDEETRAMIYGKLQGFANNVAYNLYHSGQRDAGDALLRGISGWGVPAGYDARWRNDVYDLYGQGGGQQKTTQDLESLYQTEGVDYDTLNGVKYPAVKDNWERIPYDADLSYMNPNAQSQTEEGQQILAQQAGKTKQGLAVTKEALAGIYKEMPDLDLGAMNRDTKAYLKRYQRQLTDNEIAIAYQNKNLQNVAKGKNRLVSGVTPTYGIDTGVYSSNLQKMEDHATERLITLQQENEQLKLIIQQLKAQADAGTAEASRRYPVPTKR